MPTPNAAVRAMVEGRSDEELLATAERFGGQQVVTERIVRGLADFVGPQTPDSRVGYAVRPGAATAKLDVPGCAFTVVVRDGQALVVSGSQEAEAVLTTGFPDLLRLAAGLLDVRQAAGDGRVSVTGNAEHAWAQLSGLS